MLTTSFASAFVCAAASLSTAASLSMIFELSSRSATLRNVAESSRPISSTQGMNDELSAMSVSSEALTFSTVPASIS